MRYCVPLYPILVVTDAAHAERVKVKFGELLARADVKMLLLANGIQLSETTMGPPYKIDERGQ